MGMGQVQVQSQHLKAIRYMPALHPHCCWCYELVVLWKVILVSMASGSDQSYALCYVSGLLYGAGPYCINALAREGKS